MNMSQAVQLCKGHAKQHRAVLAIAEVMEEIVNLEDMRDEALKQCKESVAAKKNAASEKEQVELSLLNASLREKNMKKVYEEISEKAHKQANIIIIEASDKAKEIVEKANETVALVTSNMRDDRDAHMEVMEGLDKEIYQKEEHLNKVSIFIV